MTCTLTITVGHGDDDAHYDLYAPAMMQTAASFYQPPLATKQISTSMGDSTRASVNHLLAGAYSTPCSTAAHAFIQIVPPLSRFQLALDVLMPMLDAPVEVSARLPTIVRRSYGVVWSGARELTARAFVSAANPTYTRVIYTVLTIRTSSDLS